MCNDALVLHKGMHYEESSNPIRNVDRGGLLYPRPFAVNAVICGDITVCKRIRPAYEDNRLQEENHRQQAARLMVPNASSYVEHPNVCEHHKPENILKMTMGSATKALSRNYRNTKRNTSAIQPKGSKKRRPNTLVTK